MNPSRSVRLMSIARPSNPVAAGSILVSDTDTARTLANYFQIELTGTTAQRPVASDPDVGGFPAGTRFYDTTLGKVVYYDGASWRDPSSGSAV